MRAFLLTTFLLTAATAATAANAQTEPAQPGGPQGWHGEHRGGWAPRGRLFVSPMGEPFRGGEGGGAPQDRWFDGADTNHDGVLTATEMEADAARFFAVLDRGHDGEIDPGDIDYYENTLLPEMRSGGGGGMGMMGGGGHRDGGHGGHHGGGGHRRGGYGGGQGGGEGARAAPSGEARQGAGRFGYFAFPEPVMAADRNFNRGVDPQEFQRAADERFALLDTNGDGRIEKRELPALPSRPAREHAPAQAMPDSDGAADEGAPDE